MLRKRSRPVGGKQSLMADSQSLPTALSSGIRQTKPAPCSLFPALRSFSSKGGFSDQEAAMSPTSILESKHVSSFSSLFVSDRHPKKPLFDAASEPIGLGILDALSGEGAKEESSNPQRRMVVFGSQLKVQIPGSPIEFGVKNKDSQLALFSPVLRSLGGEPPAFSPRRNISVSEMELSEDYTCVISHGPNPKTTHIFDNCIVESCGEELSPLREEIHRSSPSRRDCKSADGFFNSCCACKKNQGERKGASLQRDGEFCRMMCRYNEIHIDDELDNNLNSTCSSPNI